MPLFCIISLNSVASGVHHCVKVVEDVSVKKFTFAILSPNEFLVDYCNSLLYGMSNILLRRFQAIHAARLVTGTPKCDISLVLQQLHWLPICDSEWNLSSLSWSTLHALNNLAPSYLSDDCQLVATTGRRQVQSSDSFRCTITCTSSHIGDQAFAAAGPPLLNSLPVHCPLT